MTTGYVLKIEGMSEEEIIAKLERDRRYGGASGYQIATDIPGSNDSSFSDEAFYVRGKGLVVWFHGPGSQDKQVWRNVKEKTRETLGRDVELRQHKITRSGDLNKSRDLLDFEMRGLEALAETK